SLLLCPRSVRGLLAGLAFLWVFLFFPPLAPLRSTIFSLWIAYTVVWLAYGMRLVSSSLLQVGPELEEAARSAGASQGRVTRDVTLPLIRYGLLASWLLVFMIFEREYSTGVYLLGPGTEVIGSLLVSLWGTGAAESVAALSFINVVLVAIGLTVALRFGVKLHELDDDPCGRCREQASRRRPAPFVRRQRDPQGRVDAARPGRGGLAARPLGQRQDDAAARRRRPRGTAPRHDPDRGPAGLRRRRRPGAAAREAQPRPRLPVVRALAASH